jgi:hypothetical protein
MWDCLGGPALLGAQRAQLALAQGETGLVAQPLGDGQRPGGGGPRSAWELYVEPATRIATVPLGPNEGLREALSSLHSMFLVTREIPMARL